MCSHSLPASLTFVYDVKEFIQKPFIHISYILMPVFYLCEMATDWHGSAYLRS